MYDLVHFTLRDMTECSAALRKLGIGADSMEEVACRMVGYLYDALRGPDGERACVLVRLFKTHLYGALDAELRAYADQLLGGCPPDAGLVCLTLLASAGAVSEWNSRHASKRHKAIPLVNEETLLRMPMIAQLLQQLGIEPGVVVRPDPSLFRDLGQRTYNVFHVAEAMGSPYVPDQETFVRPFGIRSVIGFGGMLSEGDLFAVILFSRVGVPATTADLFKSLALSAKLALLPFAPDKVFACEQRPREVRS